MRMDGHQQAETRKLVEGEFAFFPTDFRDLAELVRTNSGIDLPASKATLVYARLTKRLRELRLKTFRDYCEVVRSDDTERHRMIAALTTNVTRFFREPHHFEHLKKTIIEPLAASANRGRRIRFWSAACSSGQEPYSIALSVLSVIPDAAKLDIKILATDLNPFVVETGRQGLYETSEVKDIAGAMRARFFERLPDGCCRICQEARDLVEFRELNLIGHWPMKGVFDAVFCRNVMIYFDRQTQETVWGRLAGVLRPGGALYIGHSERVSGDGIRNLKPDGITTYRMEGAIR